MSDLSLPENLFRVALDAIVKRYGLSEDIAEDGGPYLPLTCHAPFAEGMPVGQMRRYTGGSLFQVVTSSIVVPQIQLDSHMLFAFTPSDSPIPHFTVDSVKAGDHFAFHLDLIPRVDIGSHLNYLREVYKPLTEACEEARAVEGFTKAELSPLQWAIMSPWMMANRADEQSFPEIEKTVRAYMAHWMNLVENGVSDAAVDGISEEDLRSRDKRSKEMIFSVELDPVWNQIRPLVGDEACDRQIATLRAVSD